MNLLSVYQIPTRIIDIIENARDYCFLISPYYRPWPLLMRALEKVAQRSTRVIFVFRYNEVDRKDIEFLNKELHFDVALVERLHSKIYLNESEALITSMNLYDSSKENNYEVGCHFPLKDEAKDIHDKIVLGDILSLKPKAIFPSKYFKGNLTNEKKEKKSSEKISNFVPSKGFCIRCKTVGPWNPERPFCEPCFENWFHNHNEEHEEKYCHLCSSASKTSMNKPVCYNCFVKYKENVDFRRLAR